MPKAKIAPEDVIEVIHGAGGVAVLAHPAADRLLSLVPDLVRSGLEGLEVWHPLHRRDQSDATFALAEQYGLLKTGGSDWHGDSVAGEGRLGSVRVSGLHVESLRAAIARRRSCG